MQIDYKWGVPLKICSDLYASIESQELLKLLGSDESLKAFVQSEVDRAKDEYDKSSCSSCTGGRCQKCTKNNEDKDPAFLTSALISIFNYYIPDDIKDAIGLQSSTYLDNKYE